MAPRLQDLWFAARYSGDSALAVAVKARHGHTTGSIGRQTRTWATVMP